MLFCRCLYYWSTRSVPPSVRSLPLRQGVRSRHGGRLCTVFPFSQSPPGFDLILSCRKIFEGGRFNSLIVPRHFSAYRPASCSDPVKRRWKGVTDLPNFAASAPQNPFDALLVRTLLTIFPFTLRDRPHRASSVRTIRKSGFGRQRPAFCLIKALSEASAPFSSRGRILTVHVAVSFLKEAQSFGEKTNLFAFDFAAHHSKSPPDFFLKPSLFALGVISSPRLSHLFEFFPFVFFCVACGTPGIFTFLFVRGRCFIPSPVPLFGVPMALADISPRAPFRTTAKFDNFFFISLRWISHTF